MHREPIAGASRLYQDYLQTHKKGAKGLNLKDWGRLLGWVCLVGSLVFWIPIEWVMAEPIDSLATAAIAVAFGCFMSFGPPVIVSIFTPGTRAGRLLLKLNIATPGKVVALGAGLFLIYHAGRLLFIWWRGRAAGAFDLAIDQTILGVIFTIIAPALLFEPLSEAELHEELETAHKTQVYEIASASRISLMLKAQHNAESLMAKGLENLSARELDVIAGYIRSFVSAVDQTHREWQAQIKQASGLTVQYRPLGADSRTTELLGFLGNLTSISDVDVTATQRELSEYVQSTIAAGRREGQQLAPLPAPVAAPALTAAARVEATAVAHDGPQQPTEATTVDTSSAEAYGLVYAALQGREPFVRADVETVLQVKRSKAGSLLADWKTRGWVVEVEGLKHHYAFAVVATRQ